MRTVYCVVPGCRSNNREHPWLAFFSLPKNNDLLNQWTMNMNIVEFMEKPSGSRSHTKVCALHFETNKFRTCDRNKLIWRAVPTLMNVDYDVVPIIPSKNQIVADPSNSSESKPFAAPSTSKNREEIVTAEPLAMLITSPES